MQQHLLRKPTGCGPPGAQQSPAAPGGVVSGGELLASTLEADHVGVINVIRSEERSEAVHPTQYKSTWGLHNRIWGDTLFDKRMARNTRGTHERHTHPQTPFTGVGIRRCFHHNLQLRSVLIILIVLVSAALWFDSTA